jgi:uncharacterized protein YecE (DUF72 family)
MSGIRIGISGWTYPPWRGKFYPKGLPIKRELEYASQHFNSIEINGTFYGMQRPSSFESWFEQTPDEFVFAVKGSRFITHLRKLKDVDTPLANFFASGVLRLEHKLGPILWQFPAQMPFALDRVEEFLELLPRDFKQAAALARKHDDRIKAKAYLRVDENRPIRHAFEMRNPEYFREEFVTLLRKHNAALVIADSAGKFPYAEDITADFIYIRLHGSKELYASGYGDVELKRWTKRIETWRTGSEPRDAQRVGKKSKTSKSKRRDVHVYFDNDAKVFAPSNAKKLATLLKVKTPA